MKKSLVALALLASAGFSTSAYALPAGALSVTVSASVEPSCEFTANSADISLTTVGQPVSTVVSFVCNYDGNVYSYITTQNGTLYDPDAQAKARYQIWFGDATPGPVANWAGAQDYVEGPRSTAPVATNVVAGQEHPTNLAFALSERLPKAGNYSDVVTISVAP